MADKSSKTEKPTAKRLREAKKKGQIPKSPEVVAWGSLFVLSFVIPMAMRNGANYFTQLYLHCMAIVRNPDIGAATKLFGEAVRDGAVALAPILGAAVLAGILLNVVQSGMSPSVERLKPRFSQLNVAKGIANLFKPQNLWKLVKDLMKFAAVGWLAWGTVQSVVATVMGAGVASVTATAAQVGAASMTLLRNVAMLGLVIAAIDYGVQRRTVMSNLRMSKEEIKQEYRQTEGDPMLKSAIRSRMMSMSRMRMMSELGNADVVVMNPTHFAVALQYVSGSGAPRCIAKGKDLIALKIKERARELRIPVVEDPPLARTLYKLVEIDREIPPELYAAIAQLLAFIFTMRARGAADKVHVMPESLLGSAPAAR